jgi:phospholipid/cholesterol/gamma-HCH transport system substrate-binding protein
VKYKNEIKVGIVAIIGIGLLVYGANYLKGIDIFKKNKQLFAVYNQIDGLTASNFIQVNGFTVGKVSNVFLHPENSEKIVVSMLISDPSVKIPKNSIAKIVSLDLLGTKAIQLKLGDGVLLVESGDTLVSELEEDIKTAVDKRIQPLEKKIKDLIAQVDSAVTVVKVVFNESARENLTKSFESIRRAILTFEKTSLKIDTLVDGEKYKIEEITRNINSITSNIKKNNEQISKVITNFSTISDSIAKMNLVTTMHQASKVIGEASVIMDKINKGEGTIGMLVNNDSLYRNLERSSTEMDLLLEDMRINPERYIHFSIFGKREKPKHKPEKKPK